MTIRNKLILDIFSSSYPNAKCSLVFSSPFQCVVAVSLSAQTTDKAVNLVTPKLFSLFPNPYAFSKADIKEIEKLNCILNLENTKATKRLKELLKEYNLHYAGFLLYCFILVKLICIQVIIKALFRHQLLMIASFDNLPMLYNGD